MTLVLAVVTPRFGLMIADDMAQSSGPTTVHLRDNIRVQAEAGAKVTGVQKLIPTNDGEGLLGLAGDWSFHQSYVKTAVGLPSIECNKFLLDQMATLQCFENFDSLPDDCAPVKAQECLHCFRQKGQFVISRLQGSSSHAVRDFIRGGTKPAPAWAIGSGHDTLKETINGDFKANWQALKENSNSTPEDFVSFLKPVFRDVASRCESVGATIQAWKLLSGDRWQKLS